MHDKGYSRNSKIPENTKEVIRGRRCNVKVLVHDNILSFSVYLPTNKST